MNNPPNGCLIGKVPFTLWLFNITMEAMAHRNRWFTYYKWWFSIVMVHLLSIKSWPPWGNPWFFHETPTPRVFGDFPAFHRCSRRLGLSKNQLESHSRRYLVSCPIWFPFISHFQFNWMVNHLIIIFQIFWSLGASSSLHRSTINPTSTGSSQESYST